MRIDEKIEKYLRVNEASSFEKQLTDLYTKTIRKTIIDMNALAAILDTGNIVSDLERSIGVGVRGSGIKAIHTPNGKKLAKQLKSLIHEIENYYDDVIEDAQAHDKDHFRYS